MCVCVICVEKFATETKMEAQQRFWAFWEMMMSVERDPRIEPWTRKEKEVRTTTNSSSSSRISSLSQQRSTMMMKMFVFVVLLATARGVSLRGRETPPSGGKVELNPDSRYWGEPDIQVDGTEGNGAYYKGNFLPENPAIPKEHEKYWRKSPYWNYFKSVWGDAPMADTNFELWLRGFFKDFTVPRHPATGQTTKGLPAWLHYFSNKYDPIEDPPYISDYALFATEDGAEAAEKRRPDDMGTPEELYSGKKEIFADCSEYHHASGTIDRPCGKRNAQRYMQGDLTKKSHPDPIDRKHKWTDKRNMAGPIDKSFTDSDEELKDTYIKIDNFWGKGNEDKIPSNMPNPPAEPDMTALGPEAPVEGGSETPP